MKLRKALMGVVVAAATVLGGLGAAVSTAVAAPDPAPQPTITLDAGMGTTLDAANFEAYKLVGYQNIVMGTGADAGKVQSVEPERVSDSVHTAIHDALKAASVRTIPDDVANDHLAEAYLLRQTGTDGGEISQIATFLAQSDQIAKLGTPTPATAVSDSQLRITVPSSGLYLVTDASDQAQPIIVSSTIVNGTQVATQMVNGQILGVSNVKDVNSYAPVKSYTNDDGVEGTYVAVGNTAHFTAHVLVPLRNTYKQFTLVDNSTGYSINKDVQVAFTKDVSTKPTESDWADVVPAGDLAYVPATGTPVTGFTITDNSPAVADADPSNPEVSIIAQHGDEVMWIRYTATVTDPKATNAIGMTTVTRDGQTNHNEGNATVNGVAGILNLLKVNASDFATPVKGAQFSIRSTQGVHNGHYLVRKSVPSGSTTLNSWSYSTGTDAPTSPETGLIEGDGHGHFDLSGLPQQGSFLLHEEKVPTGYIGQFTQDVNITVKGDGTYELSTPAGSLNAQLFKLEQSGTPGTKPTVKTAWDDTKNTYVVTQTTDGTDATETRFHLGNLSSITQLPKTGGSGAIAVALLVALLLGAGAAIGLGARKARRNAANAR